MAQRVSRTLWMVTMACLLTFTSAELFAQPGQGVLPPGGMHRWIWAGRLPVITMTGTVVVDSVLNLPGQRMLHVPPIYMLDTARVTGHSTILFFGPPGYEPASGAQRPTAGDTVTVRGGIDTTRTPEVLVVYQIDGKQWRDSTGAPAWGRWITRNGTDTVQLISDIDTLSRAFFPPGLFGTDSIGGMMWPDSMFLFMSEFLADTMKAPEVGRIFAGFQFGAYRPGGSWLMQHGAMGIDSTRGFGTFTFRNPIRIRFHLMFDSLAAWNVSPGMLKVYSFGAGNSWKQVADATVDSIANTITVTDTVLASFYLIAAPVAVSVEPIDNAVPAAFSLMQNYPNPFNPSTTIEFAVPKTSRVTLEIFDQLGRRVTTLVSGELAAGSYRTQWNATGLASGVYYYRLVTPGFTQTKSLMLLK